MQEMNVEMPGWEELEKQKEALLTIVCNKEDYPNLTAKDFECIENVITFMDYTLYTTHDEFGVPESMAFCYPA